MSLSIQKGSSVKPGTPQVSVIVPCYNITEFIAETLESVFTQTFTDYEVILINDGSPDTPEFEKAIAPFLSKIVYVKKAQNEGLPAGRNTGVRTARGELIAFLDGDDIWKPDFLEKQVKFLQDNNFDMVFTDAEFFGETGLAGRKYGEFSPTSLPVTTAKILKFEACIIISSSLVKKSRIVEVGYFDETNFRADDFDMWVRLAFAGFALGYQNNALMKYRMRVGSLSGNSVQRVERQLESLTKLENKLSFGKTEKNAIKQQKDKLSGIINLEKGKAHLLKKEFAEADQCFAESQKTLNTAKMRIVRTALKVAPNFLRLLYRKTRAEESRYLST
jgi:glycosyltransferase involved in cell wall biosynthesis